MNDKEMLDALEKVLDDEFGYTLNRVKETAEIGDAGHHYLKGRLEVYRELRDMVTLKRKLDGIQQ